MTIKMYLVGGAVRDQILGIPSNDLDFAVEAPSYEAMRAEIERRGGTIFLEKPEYLTIRARIPELGAADYVLCRKDGSYIDGRRPEDVEPGTLIDDLSRRDFTMNAIAMTEDGEYIDPFNGRQSMDGDIIHCVGDTYKRFEEDYLRMLRAIRFSITKDMTMSPQIFACLEHPEMVRHIRRVATERVREEMLKCFHCDTLKTLKILECLPLVRDAIFDHGALWLKPTLEK